MRLKKGSDRKETGMVFTKDNREWLHPDSIPRWLNNFSRDNGLPHIHPHVFRHTAASTMIANGVDLVTTAAELGHANANANTTATIYAPDCHCQSDSRGCPGGGGLREENKHMLPAKRN